MMNINGNYYYSIEQMASKIGDVTKPKNTNNKNYTKGLNTSQNTSFKDILENSINKLTFSKHALERLDKRHINLSTSQIERLTSGADLARQKGIKESLVLLDDYAFIVNTKTNTVVTAMGNDEKKVFTNIDGAIIM